MTTLVEHELLTTAAKWTALEGVAAALPLVAVRVIAPIEPGSELWIA